MGKTTVWTKEKCQNLANLCTYRKEFELLYTSAYQACSRNKWLDEICSHMQYKHRSWTKELCHEEALKYTYRWEFEQKAPDAHAVGYKNNWLDNICSHMEVRKLPANYWTIEACQKEALKYQYRWEFGESNRSAYSAAMKNNWLDNICSHMKIKCNDYSLEDLQDEANKYSSRTDFAKGSPNQYRVACRRKLLDQLCVLHIECVQSKPENELLSIIKNKYPLAKKRRFGKIKRGEYGQCFELDVYIPELNQGIEFNGTYWHSLKGLTKSRHNWSVELLVNYHQIKRVFFKSKNIDYLEIEEKDWKTDKQNCIDRVFQFLGSK